MLANTIQNLSLLAQSDGGGTTIVAGVTLAFFLIISFAMFIFWLWMLIDCLTRTFEGVEKIVWLLVIFFFPLVGALLYLFIGRARGTKG